MIRPSSALVARVPRAICPAAVPQFVARHTTLRGEELDKQDLALLITIIGTAISIALSFAALILAAVALA